MHQAITKDTLTEITNPSFRENAQIYIDIEDDFRAQVKGFGLDFSTESFLAPYDPWVRELEERGLVIANDSKSLHVGWFSPSCESCRKGIGTATYLFTTQCPRNCFFCFNPNQYDYDRLRTEFDDPTRSLVQMHAGGIAFRDLALTGGEPLIDIDRTIDFFQVAKRLYPKAYTRLYTSGAFLDEDCVARLALAGLDEIRFSVKTYDSKDEQEELFKRIELAVKTLPSVVVEMPIMPDELEVMKALLVRLDEIGVDGINLLELGFPYNNAEEFSRRGYELKQDPFRVLYDYTYAGGLPIAGSEDVCLRLLGFAIDQGLGLGVHYCSLENKYSGQVYQQNIAQKEAFGFCEFSSRDYFLKSLKAYGHDAVSIECLLVKHGLNRFRKDTKNQVIEFSPTYVEHLLTDFPDLQLALSYHVIEGEGSEAYLRELRLDRTTPSTFNPLEDL